MWKPVFREAARKMHLSAAASLATLGEYTTKRGANRQARLADILNFGGRST
jgi:hypothetical protein